MLTVEPSGTVRHRAIGTVSGTVTGGSGVTRNHCAIQLTAPGLLRQDHSGGASVLTSHHLRVRGTYSTTSL